MRRQTAATARVLREESCRVQLDPRELPARVSYHPPVRPGAAPQIAIIGHDSVMIRRETGAGVPLYMTVPVAAYSGIVLSVREAPGGPLVALRLHHINGDLGVPLYEADDTCDVIAEWQLWARALRRPLLIENAAGEIFEPFERLGGVVVKPAKARRANRFFAERRPRFLCKRRVGRVSTAIVHPRAEIIARDVAD